MIGFLAFVAIMTTSFWLLTWYYSEESAKLSDELLRHERTRRIDAEISRDSLIDRLELQSKRPEPQRYIN